MIIYRTLFMAASLAAVAAPAFAAEQLRDLPSVEQALDEGKAVSVVLELARCQPGSGEAKPTQTQTQTRGGKRIDAYRITEDGTLAFADDHFTIDRNGNPINQFLRYRIHKDGMAEFSMTTFSMPDLRPVGTSLAYTCSLNQGMRFVAAQD